MNNFTEMLASLRTHHALCLDLLALAERESETLRRAPAPELSPLCQAKKTLLPRLTASLEILRAHRVQWQALRPAERQQQPDIGTLIRQTQDLIMRILLLERENEQSWLRRGLIPARELASVSGHQQRPHFVAGLYQRTQS